MDKPELPVRKRLRLANYDYTQTGCYFITVCVLDMRCLFGAVTEGRVQLSELGNLISKTWLGLEQIYPGMKLDEYIVMPDHMHGIIQLLPDQDSSIPQILQRFKSESTQDYFRYKESSGRMDLAKQLWERSYYERVIRSESDLYEKRSYISTNPLRWSIKRTK